MDEYQKISYVYLHKDPTTNEIVYVGIGVGSRAWLHGRTQRGREHHLYLDSLLKDGYVPSDWVAIHSSKLTRLESKLTEKDLIAKHSPRFNISLNKPATVKRYMNKHSGVYDTVKNLNAMGYGCRNIAYLLGADNKKTKAMSVWRILNANG